MRALRPRKCAASSGPGPKPTASPSDRAMSPAIPQERLRSLIHRHEAVTAMLSAGPKRDEYVRLSRELAELDPVAEKARALAAAERAHADIEALIADAATDG